MEENITNEVLLKCTVKRLPDTQWKEFRVTLQEDPNPSATGNRERCTQAP